MTCPWKKKFFGLFFLMLSGNFFKRNNKYFIFEKSKGCVGSNTLLDTGLDIFIIWLLNFIISFVLWISSKSKNIFIWITIWKQLILETFGKIFRGFSLLIINIGYNITLGDVFLFLFDFFLLIQHSHWSFLFW